MKKNGDAIGDLLDLILPVDAQRACSTTNTTYNLVVLGHTLSDA